MAVSQQDISFKILINKEANSTSSQFFQETTVSTIDTHYSEVFASYISSSANWTTGSGTARLLTQFTMSANPTYPVNAFYLLSGSGFTPGISAFDATKAQRNFISDKYGTAYTALLYDNNNTQIFPTDAVGWFFNYKTGILQVSSPGAYVLPYKMTVYQYTGKYLLDSGSIPSYSVTGFVASASFATTASFAMNGGGGAVGASASGSNGWIQYASGSTLGATSNFTYNSASSQLTITGSLVVSGNMYASNFVPSFISNITASVGYNTVYNISTGSYNGAFTKYIAISSSNARAGQISTVWIGNTAVFNEATTIDIGDTSGVVPIVSVVAPSNIQLQFYTPSTWAISTITEFLPAG